MRRQAIIALPWPGTRMRPEGRFTGLRSALSGLVAAISLLPSGAGAIDTASLAFASVAGDGWSAHDVRIELALTPGPDGQRGGRLFAARMNIPLFPEPMTDVRVDCPSFELEGRRVRCADASIDAVIPTLGRQRVRAAITYQLGSGSLDADMRGIAIGGGTARIRGVMAGDTWGMEVDLERTGVGALMELAKAWDLPLPALSGDGTLTAKLSARGRDAAPESIVFDGAFANLSLSNEAGTLASDKLVVAIAGQAMRENEGWRLALRTSARQGQGYSEPVFLDFGVHPFAATAEVSWPDTGPLTIARFTVDHEAVLRAEGSARLDLEAESMLEQLDMAIEHLTFPGAYASYLQPFLIDTSLKELETVGSIAGSVVVADGAPARIDLDLAAVSADDGTGTLAIYGLNGTVHWQAGDTPAADSSLAWDGGLLFGLDLGATSLAFRTHERDFELLSATRVPLLDGAVMLERFAVRSAGLPEMAFALDAEVLPISVERLSRAFGWPEFGGQLAGRISDLRLDDGVLTLATTLRANVFDGRIEISNLRLEQPFGDWPRLYSSIDIFNLDLEQLTSAFSFGLITGRLSGYVNELVLFDWMPIEFDLRLYTPPDDRSRHRISQRAVQNIGNIGGGGAGIGAALSGGFMSFFDEFNYARLGISCRLENEVCLMDGVDPAPNGGYYLVKGRGLPRINVIGNADRVDWPRLVGQLRAIAASEGPVVE